MGSTGFCVKTSGEDVGRVVVGTGFVVVGMVVEEVVIEAANVASVWDGDAATIAAAVLSALRLSLGGSTCVNRCSF